MSDGDWANRFEAKLGEYPPGTKVRLEVTVEDVVAHDGRLDFSLRGQDGELYQKSQPLFGGDAHNVIHHVPSGRMPMSDCSDMAGARPPAEAWGQTAESRVADRIADQIVDQAEAQTIFGVSPEERARERARIRARLDQMIVKQKYAGHLALMDETAKTAQLRAGRKAKNKTAAKARKKNRR